MNAYGERMNTEAGFYPSHTQIDASTQVDLVGYESEDERMSRRNRSKRGTSYSKIDIREQYCINNKEVQVLESGSSAFFGCLSKHNNGSCRSRQFFLSGCVARVPSEENLHDFKFQPLPRRPIDDLERAYLRRRPKSHCSGDTGRCTWIPEDEDPAALDVGKNKPTQLDCIGIKRGHTISFSTEHLATSCPAHYLPPPPPPPAGRTKHVSFARSRTLTSFDDAMIELQKTSQLFKSQERLILSTNIPKRQFRSSYDPKVIKKTSMKTQATQTGCLRREPPTYLSLSPRTIHRVKMVSQGAQTNGQLYNGRRLMKSYSEAGYSFMESHNTERNKEHDTLIRTQSEEPRSPFSKQGLSRIEDDEINLPDSTKGDGKKLTKHSKIYKEILIDFEPVEEDKIYKADEVFVPEPKAATKVCNSMIDVVDRVDGIKVSSSSCSVVSEDDFLNENQDNPIELFPHIQNSIEEEFHENLIYGGILNKFSSSEQSLKPESQNDKECSEKQFRTSTPDLRDIISMTTLNVSRKASPFASSDSLGNDQKDHSDGLWNESQSTVLQAELENGEINIRAPSKKHLLMLQHQQRSSIDTEVLESDPLYSQSPLYSPSNKNSGVPFVTVAAVNQSRSSNSVTVPDINKTDAVTCTLTSVSNSFSGAKDYRRKLSKSPEKDDIRLDSGKITDISENSTTEDYATAYDNSGTDTSSKKSINYHYLEKKLESQIESKEGSSFESASSVHIYSKEDTLQTVPSSAPPTPRIENVQEHRVKEIEVEKKLNELNEFQDQPEITEKEDLSGDAESSSSGSYSLDSGQRDFKTEWSSVEKIKIKKEFKLELNDTSKTLKNSSIEKEEEEEREENKEKEETISSVSQELENLAGTSVLTKSNQKTLNKWSKDNDETISKMVRSPAMPEGFLTENWKSKTKLNQHLVEKASKTEPEVSSDDSSYELKNSNVEETVSCHSPRRHRRKGGGRVRRGQNNIEYTSRKKSMNQVVALGQEPNSSQAKHPQNSCYVKGSPRKLSPKVKELEVKKNNAENSEVGTHLKTLSAESLRSVSPGSDSVFYNEGDAHLLCHQCGREFDEENIQTDVVEEIVQPPAGFADSPENSKNKSHRLYKKQEKRFRSEERVVEKRRYSRLRTDNLRAKSEERGKEKNFKSKIRPHTRSTNASMERLRRADSSPSISEPLRSDELKIYADPFKKASWICIVDGEANSKWNRYLDSDDEKLNEDSTNENIDSTGSEREFRKKYQAATHRMIHRKASIEMYRRLQSKTFECDKKVTVKRKSGEFGFRIHGSRPVVVSAIEPDTPAETSGLEVGDIVLSVNGVSVLEASHSDVVKLAHAGSDILELEVARTSSALMAPSSEEDCVLMSGFLNKRGSNGKWYQRWFALKNDNCLYYFKSQAEVQPIGALMLFNYKFTFTTNSDKAHSFILESEGARSLELFADTKETAYKWKACLEKAMTVDPMGAGQWFEKSCHYMHQPATSVPQPDCFGHLTQLEEKWRRRYCVLKDAALLIYSDSAADRALAVVCLQGYKVQSSGTSGKRFSFEVVPPEPKQKHFYFYTDTETDKKRWIAAIEYSIDRWMKVE